MAELSDLVPFQNPRVCPIDGQDLDWHLKVYSSVSRGIGAHVNVVFFGDRLGCGYIRPMDRDAAIREIYNAR